MLRKAFAIVLTLLAAFVAAGTARADLADDMGEDAMTLVSYRGKIHNQLDWFNRAQDNRCRPTQTLSEFTKTPLKSVNPQWRDDHVIYATNKHHRAQQRSSQCFSKVLMDWYYTSGAKCVHEHEGAWNDPNAPYYGGMQADISFQQSYNPTAYRLYGTADHWPIIEQIKMAYYGWKARGWYPWPLTARACGLL